MATTYEGRRAEAEEQAFEFGQEVSIEDLRQIVAPHNAVDVVEERRLQIVGMHVSELLREDLPPCEVDVHQASLYNLGAEAVVEYLPAR